MNVRSNTSKLLVILVAICAYGLAPAAQSASNASENAATKVPEHISQRISEIFEKLDELSAEMKQHSRQYLTPMSDDELAKVYVKIHSRPFDVALQKVKENRQLVIANLVRHGYAWSKQDDEYFDHHYEQLVGELASLGPKALPELALYMSRPYIAEGKSPLTMRALAKMGTNVVDPLIKLTDAKDNVLRKNVIHVLSGLADPQGKDQENWRSFVNETINTILSRIAREESESIQSRSLGLEIRADREKGRYQIIEVTSPAEIKGDVKQEIVREGRDYEKATEMPQPVERWKAKKYSSMGNLRMWQKLQTDTKGQSPILLTWPLIKEASKYVVQLKGVRGSRPAMIFELVSNSLSLEETDIAPGRYQWSVSVYDKNGKFMGDIETTDSVVIFAIEDQQPVEENRKKVLIDLNHSAGHMRGWGYYNHAQYMTKELLEKAGFEVEVNERDLLTAERLKSVNLLICHYYWTGWPGFRSYLKSELAAVREFVENGGSLLVVGCDRKDGGGRMCKAGNELVKEFGLMFELGEISKPHGLAEPVSDQKIISFSKPVQVQLSVGVQGTDAITLLQFNGLPIVKAKQFSGGKVIVAGVGMSFLDCYLGDFERSEPLHLIMFYDFIRYLTDIDWKKNCKQEFIEMVLSRFQFQEKRALNAGPKSSKEPQVAEEPAQALCSLDVKLERKNGNYQIIEIAPSDKIEKVLEEPLEQDSAAEDVGKPQRSLIVFPTDSTTMNLRWTPGKPDDASVVQNLELLIRRYCTYEVDTQDLVSGQVANKSLGWAVYPSVERENQRTFPVELIVRTKQPVTPHSDYRAVVKKVRDGRRLRWTANERRVPSHFGYFGLTTQETVNEVEIRRGCVPLGNGRARIRIVVRAQMPLLVRIWGLKGRFNIEPESIEPQNYRLSDNGVLFFDYGKNEAGLGNESEYSFVISGLDEEQLFYPMTNALHHVQMRSQGCPDSPMRQVRSSVWEFAFALKLKRCFTIVRLERWLNELYQLKALTVKQ